MTDIVERLRTAGMHTNFPDMLGEAADEIERLRSFLELIISAYESGTHADLFCLQVARDALKDKP